MNGYDESKSLAQYMKELADYSPLNSEDEKALVRGIKQGHVEERNKLVQANLRFVVSIAGEYQGRGLPNEDLISAGNIGLLTAAERFDETRGYKFISYAVWWIRQGIQNALKDRFIKTPGNRIGDLSQIIKLISKSEQEKGSFVSLEELSQEINMTPLRMERALSSSWEPLSLDAPYPGEDSSCPIDYLVSETPSPDKNLEDADLKNELEKALNKLNPRDRKVLRLYEGLDGEEPQTLEEIGIRLGITKERVRQIRARALKTLRGNGDELQIYLNN